MKIKSQRKSGNFILSTHTHTHIHENPIPIRLNKISRMNIGSNTSLVNMTCPSMVKRHKNHKERKCTTWIGVYIFANMRCCLPLCSFEFEKGICFNITSALYRHHIQYIRYKMKWVCIKCSHVSGSIILAYMKGVCCNSVVEKWHMWNDKHSLLFRASTNAILCNEHSSKTVTAITKQGTSTLRINEHISKQRAHFLSQQIPLWKHMAFTS